MRRERERVNIIHFWLVEIWGESGYRKEFIYFRFFIFSYKMFFTFPILFLLSSY
jgi:hypothetical protein